jgi:hypothetical protein
MQIFGERMGTIPEGLTQQHLDAAIARIDRDGVPKRNVARDYHLIVDGKGYPVKYTTRLMAEIAGTPIPSDNASFNSIVAKDHLINMGYTVIRKEEWDSIPAQIQDEDDESAFAEGTESYRKHRHLERDAAIARRAKEQRLATDGKLECECCGMDFAKVYGHRGFGFIEAHHTTPVSKLNGTVKTKISDLVMICSNCHKIIHRVKPMLTVGELRDLILANKSV